MRIARKVALLATMAAAALALTASSASAQVSVTNEATGEPCPAVSVVNNVVSGGCSAHGVSTQAVFLQGHFIGIETGDTTCDNEFTLVTDSTGNGFLTDQELTEPPAAGTTCTRRACTATGGAQVPWAANAAEAGGAETLEVDFCVENLDGSGDLNCHLTVPFVETGDHDYEFGTLSNGNPVEIPCEGSSPFVIRGEVTGHWVSEASSQVELTH